MPELIETIRYKCMECGAMHHKLEAAVLCEATDILMKFFDEVPGTENRWRKIEPICSKPTDKWTAWSNYGLARGW